MLKKWRFQVRVNNDYVEVWYRGIDKEDAIARFFSVFRMVNGNKAIVV